MNYWQDVEATCSIWSSPGSHRPVLKASTILRSSGAEYTAYMAGAHHLERKVPWRRCPALFDH